MTLRLDVAQYFNVSYSATKPAFFITCKRDVRIQRELTKSLAEFTSGEKSKFKNKGNIVKYTIHDPLCLCLRFPLLAVSCQVVCLEEWQMSNSRSTLLVWDLARDNVDPRAVFRVEPQKTPDVKTPFDHPVHMEVWILSRQRPDLRNSSTNGTRRVDSPTQLLISPSPSASCSILRPPNP